MKGSGCRGAPPDDHKDFGTTGLTHWGPPLAERTLGRSEEYILLALCRINECLFSCVLSEVYSLVIEGLGRGVYRDGKKASVILRLGEYGGMLASLSFLLYRGSSMLTGGGHFAC